MWWCCCCCDSFRCFKRHVYFNFPVVCSRKVTLISPRDIYQVGDRILLRVDLYDQRGNIRTRGGDEVRIWLKDPEQGHSTAAEVIDLGNGSYTGEATLKWTGLTHVRACLAYSREFLRLVIELRHALLSTRWIIQRFRNQQGNVSEVSVLRSAKYFHIELKLTAVFCNRRVRFCTDVLFELVISVMFSQCMCDVILLSYS